MVANPARCPLNGKNNIFLPPFATDNCASYSGKHAHLISHTHFLYSVNMYYRNTVVGSLEEMNRSPVDFGHARLSKNR